MLAGARLPRTAWLEVDLGRLAANLGLGSAPPGDYRHPGLKPLNNS